MSHSIKINLKFGELSLFITRCNNVFKKGPKRVSEVCLIWNWVHMLNLMVMLTFSGFDWKYRFRANLIKKFKIVSLKAHSQLETIFGHWKPFENGEKCFLFHLQSSFCSQDIYLFVLTFWSCIKTAWLKI